MDWQQWFLTHLDALLFASILVTICFIPLHEKLKAGGFLATLTLWVSMLANRRGQKIWIPPLGWCFILFVGVALLSALFSDYHNRATRGALDAFRYTAFFLILINTMDSYQKIEWLILALMGGMAIGNVAGIYRYFFVQPDIMILSLGEQNSVAQVLSFVLALLFGLILTLRSKYIFCSALFGITCLTAFTFLLTYSRALWLAVLAMLIFFQLIRRDWKITSIMIGLSIFLYSGMSYSEQLKGNILSLEGPFVVSILADRPLIWKESLGLMKDRPLLGIGLKTYGLEAAQGKHKMTSSAHGHNMFINVAAELGLLGLIALCLWMAFLLRTLLQIYPRMKTDFNQGLWLAGLGCFIILLIGGLAHPMLGSESSLTLMTVLGLMLAGYRIENGIPEMRAMSPAGTSLLHETGVGLLRKLVMPNILQNMRSRLILKL